MYINSEYLIHIAFPWQKWLCECTSLLCCMYSACFVENISSVFYTLTEMYCHPSVWLSEPSWILLWGYLQELILSLLLVHLILVVCTRFFHSVHQSSITCLWLNYCFLKSVQTKYRYEASGKHNSVVDIFLTLEQL